MSAMRPSIARILFGVKELETIRRSWVWRGASKPTQPSIRYWTSGGKLSNIVVPLPETNVEGSRLIVRTPS